MFSFIKSIFKGVGTFFKRFIKTAVYETVEEISEVAQTAVETVERTKKDASNEEKYKEAFNLTREVLKQRSKSYSTNAINIAIEIAVGLYKERR